MYVLSLAFCNTIFSGVVDIFKYPRHQLIINGAANSRITFVFAAIIYFCSPPVFVAPRFWEPCDQLKPGLKQEREPWERGCHGCMKNARLTTRYEVVLRSLAYTTPPSHWSFSNSSLFVHPPWKRHFRWRQHFYLTAYAVSNKPLTESIAVSCANLREQKSSNNTRRIGLGQQHGHRCIVLRRKILCKRPSGAWFTEPRSQRVATDTEVDGG